MTDLQQMVLRETLRLAVPRHMAELERLPVDMLPGIASEAAAVIATHGDDLQFGGKHCREAFNALARGLAAAALCAWGGIEFAGLHWCSQPGCSDRNGEHLQPWPTQPRRAPAPRQVQDVPVADTVL